MKTNAILLCTIALSLGACSSSGINAASGPRYTPRPAVMEKNYTQENRMEDSMDKKSFEEYEQREQCQHYRRTPRHYDDPCMIKEEVKAPVREKIVRSYTILFDFDKSNIRPEERMTLDRVARELNKYHPNQVTVTGYTDSSGAVDYNQKLSREREQAVSRALLNRGIETRTLDRKARGEYEQAVETADGVRKQENRRVVVDFIR